MDRLSFLSKLAIADDSIDKERSHAVIKRNIEASGGKHACIISLQELSELSVEVTNSLRDKIDEFGLLEELADAMISIECIRQVHDISEEQLSRAVNVKLGRVEEVLDKKGRYQ